MVKKLYTCDESDDEGDNGGKKRKRQSGGDENELLFNQIDKEDGEKGAEEVDKQQ